MRMKFLAALAGLGFATSGAFAAPINYTFTAGPVRSATGVSAGLLPTSTTISGSFTYDSSGLYIGPGASGAGSLYAGAMTNFVLNIDGQTVSDPYGYAYVANDYFIVPGPVAPGPRLWDLFEFYAGPTGPGGWSGLTIGGQFVERIRFYFEEGPIGLYPDFLSNEQLLPSLPLFTGGLSLDFGPIGGGAAYLGSAGVMQFSNFAVTAVPEPSVLSLLLMSGAALLFVRRRITVR